MENATTHSKAKLALAVFTSPAAAFEEIARRQLLGAALGIVTVTGAVAMVAPIVSARAGEHAQILMLGRHNPIAWLGLCMLFAFAMQKLLRWLGSKVDYVPMLTLMGWAQLALLLAQVCSIGVSYGQASDTVDGTISRIGTAGFIGFSLWYVLLMGTIVQTLVSAPRARGILSYIVVEIAALIGFTITYGNTRLSGFQGALPGVTNTVGAVVQADQLPWLGASVIGLVIGVWIIGKHFGWPMPKVKLNAAAAGVLGLAALGGYAFGMAKLDYYGRLDLAQAYYANGHYAAAAKSFDSLVGSITRDNIKLLFDVAEMYYLAGDDDLALKRLDTAMDEMRIPSEATNPLIAYADNYRGIIYDAQGKYPLAVTQFEHAAKQWTDFREPWVRLAVTYDRMGKYDKAIEAGNHAIKKLDSEAVVAWVALAEAFAHTGDETQEKAAIAMVVGKDKKLAEKIDSAPGGWKSAVDQLTRKDLKVPLETEMAKQPAKATKTEKPKK